ncbi:MAG: hypothetical protein HOG08_01615 [Candidatus Magasanikbacteria bacterium]|nr:hypothetical protein [Candidatus Magasanikbacteria bacterium]
MPIRRVMVDWRDGDISNDERMGFYKNRKPVCEENDSVSEGIIPKAGYCKDEKNSDKYRHLTCDLDHDCPVDATCELLDRDSTEKHFGDLPRACKEEYFEFTHEYTCDKSMIARVEANPETAPDYVKKVQDLEEDERERVLATSNDLTDDDYVCVYKPRVQVLDNWGWCNGECEGEEGCYNDGIISNCDIKQESEVVLGINPWKNYSGEIIIIP